jgi:hypothetical protein
MSVIDGSGTVEQDQPSIRISVLKYDMVKRANTVVDNLENDIYPNDADDTAVLPKCIYISEFRSKPHLVFDMRKDGDVSDKDKRLSLKMVLPTEYNLQDELERFREKITAKYGDGII